MCGLADHAVAGDRRHLGPGHPGTQRGQLFHHDPGPPDPVVADAVHRLGQGRVGRVEQVGQQVQALAALGAGQFHARDQGQARGQGRPGLGVPGHGVVVGQGDHVQAAGPGAGHQFGPRVGSVRGIAVGVQVNEHQASNH